MKRKLTAVAFEKKLRAIRLVATDFDGIHTDGMVYVDQQGRETVRCSRKDGLAFNMLERAKILACVISKETNDVVRARCTKLQIPCYNKIETSDAKVAILRQVMDDKGVTREQVLYMGDDINDIACLQMAGVAVTVSDGHQLAKDLCDYVTKARGGEHAIRELVELILKAQNFPIEF